MLSVGGGPAVSVNKYIPPMANHKSTTTLHATTPHSSIAVVTPDINFITLFLHNSYQLNTDFLLLPRMRSGRLCPPVCIYTYLNSKKFAYFAIEDSQAYSCRSYQPVKLLLQDSRS